MKKITAPISNDTVIDITDIADMKKNTNKPSFSEKNAGRILEYYILGEIDEAEEYAEWFNQIRNCGPNDVVIFHFNSPGGDLFTAIQFMRVINECQALTVASIEGACMSAATLIFLACDTFEVSAHSAMMIHNYSGAAFGKGGEMHSQITFESKWIETLFKEVYINFLSQEEIQNTLKGQDLWLTSSEIVQRLNERKELKKASEAASKQ
jgi:ATP-dependent protease ClpP protease subunit